MRAQPGGGQTPPGELGRAAHLCRS
uniref:Uncharacterized protein n=1 Tax=Arundo donax TaxID=35708 RepID=A0A0A8ZBI3_ARUDO